MSRFEIDRETLRRLYEDDSHSIANIAVIFDVSPAAVQRKMEKYLIKRRPRGGEQYNKVRKVPDDELMRESYSDLSEKYKVSRSALYRRRKKLKTKLR